MSHAKRRALASFSSHFQMVATKFEIPFPQSILPPSHVTVERGLIQNTSTFVPQKLDEYEFIGSCNICNSQILKLDELLVCCNRKNCDARYHMICLAKHALMLTNEYHLSLFPISAKCIKCSEAHRWGDLIREQRCILAIDAMKPVCEEGKIAIGMLPKRQMS
ncbi:hypothetical protein AB6A40_004456 [Gnathostoma spinigerum]|uniref:Zinc finger PHD-type domain-containing protein n=1 Tax=Gnathostoma spinigerum TaxID=75299 RepID=A0ABD6EM04_9BILA